MQPAGVEKGVGIITSGYLKDQGDAAWRDDPGMNELRAFIKQWMPEADPNDSNVVYGFALGRTLQQLLTQCDGDFTRENVMKQAAGLKDVAIPVLLPGITLNTGPRDYRPIQKMQLQRWDGASWVRFGGLIEGADV
jgi:branched-chain amino acid transport system substrate-binding protein